MKVSFMYRKNIKLRINEIETQVLRLDLILYYINWFDR